jgi:hypothetical protein
MLVKGQVFAALELLQQQGPSRRSPGAEESIRIIAKAYAELPVYCWYASNQTHAAL